MYSENIYVVVALRLHGVGASVTVSYLTLSERLQLLTAFISRSLGVDVKVSEVHNSMQSKPLFYRS